MFPEVSLSSFLFLLNFPFFILRKVGYFFFFLCSWKELSLFLFFSFSVLLEEAKILLFGPIPYTHPNYHKMKKKHFLFNNFFEKVFSIFFFSRKVFFQFFFRKVVSIYSWPFFDCVGSFVFLSFFLVFSFVLPIFEVVCRSNFPEKLGLKKERRKRKKKKKKRGKKKKRKKEKKRKKQKRNWNTNINQRTTIMLKLFSSFEIRKEWRSVGQPNVQI